MTLQFNSIYEFLTMGGYGLYVWLAYGITFSLFALFIWKSKKEINQTLALVKKIQMREQYKRSDS